MRPIGTSAALGAAVVDARKQQGWTQVHLAEQANISTPALSRMERGNRHCEIGTVLSVVDALGMELGLVEKHRGSDDDPLGDLLDDLASDR